MFADKNQWIIQGKKYTACSSHSAAQPGLTLAGGHEVEPAWLGGTHAVIKGLFKPQQRQRALGNTWSQVPV